MASKRIGYIICVNTLAAASHHVHTPSPLSPSPTPPSPKPVIISSVHNSFFQSEKFSVNRAYMSYKSNKSYRILQEHRYAPTPYPRPLDDAPISPDGHTFIRQLFHSDYLRITGLESLWSSDFAVIFSKLLPLTTR